jgi:hypothetical protein
MNKRAAPYRQSPAKRAGKKRKASSITGSQTEASPIRNKALNKQRDFVLRPTKIVTNNAEVIDLSQEDEVVESSPPPTNNRPRNSPQKARSDKITMIEDVVEDDHIMGDVQLPQLPSSPNGEQGHPIPESQNFPTSELSFLSTDYQTSEMNLPTYELQAPSGPRTNVEKLIALVKEMTPNSLDESRDEIIKGLNDLGVHDCSTPRASLEPELVHSVKNRIFALERAMQDTVSKIPESEWAVYRRNLTQLVEGKAILSMNFCQRLSKVMEIVYLCEELQAMETGDWSRLDAAIRVTAAMAEVTGPEDEEVPDLVEAWVEAKVQDISWLKKTVNIRDKFAAEADKDVTMERS